MLFHRGAISRQGAGWFILEASHYHAAFSCYLHCLNFAGSGAQQATMVSIIRHVASIIDGKSLSIIPGLFELTGALF